MSVFGAVPALAQDDGKPKCQEEIMENGDTVITCSEIKFTETGNKSGKSSLFAGKKEKVNKNYQVKKPEGMPKL
jgi:hypothetical protein